MKGSSHKSHKHNSKDSHTKRHNASNRPEPHRCKNILKERPYRDDSPPRRSEPDRSRNILKERPYRDDSPPRRSEKGHRDNSKSSNPKKDRNRDSGNSQDRHKPDVFSSSGRSEDEKYKSRKQQAIDESYEELSRKKRRIESELKALDLEEAAARQNESRKHKKDTSNHSKKRKGEPRIKEEPRFKEEPRIKEEPMSDDDRASRTNRKKPVIKTEENADRNPGSPPDEEQDWGNSETAPAEKVKEKPNFATSGKLAEDTNTYNGVVIKYNQPSEARKPKRRWRLYPFKGDSDLPFIPIHRQSAYLFGRTRSIADIPIDHPSCSKQHAVLQFRLVSYKREDGSAGRRVRPYIIDLESSNGTFVNNKRIDPRCYVELMEKDVVKFGYSSREYVVLHEGSKNEDDDEVLDSN